MGLWLRLRLGLGLGLGLWLNNGFSLWCSRRNRLIFSLLISFISVVIVIPLWLSGIGIDGEKNLSLRDINDWRQIRIERTRSI